MAQLSDDCFAFSGPLLALHDMERLIEERIAPVRGTERVRLAEAGRRVLAENVVARIDLPPFTNSAVDGYAVRFSDLNPGQATRLALGGRIMAGKPSAAPIAPGTAARIFTGAPMPLGADTVFMQEDCEVSGAEVILPPGLRHGANRRLAGEDIRAGSCALAAGRRLGPADLALAAALGRDEVVVCRRVRVALFSTGDEVAEPGAALQTAAVYDANRALLGELLRRLGADVDDLGILTDDADGIASSLQAAAHHHDLIVTSGGVSTGEADYVRAGVERLGSLVFWRLGIKPGRPVAMGILPGLAPAECCGFVGLPGNPVAVFVTFVRVVRPLLLRLSGANAERLLALPVRAAFTYRKKRGRREYVRATLRQTAGGLEAEKFLREGAGVITSLTETDGLLELGEEITDVAIGDTVGFLPYAVLTD